MTKTGCVILNYNDYETTCSLLDKIKDFHCFEKIVLVDNCSTNDSYDHLSTYSNEKIVVLQSGKNGGYGFGNNYGIRYCSEHENLDYCLIANPDVVFSEEFVNRLTEFMDSHNDCALVSGKQVGPNASAWRETGVLGDLAFNNMLLNKLFKPRYYPDSYFKQKSCEVFAIPGCLFLARLSALYEIGLYDEEFFLFEEEKVLGKKLKKKGWKSYILTDSDYIHNHSVSIKKSIKKLGAAKRLVLKSNRLYLKKYCGVSSFAMPFIVVYHELCVLESILYSLARRIVR